MSWSSGKEKESNSYLIYKGSDNIIPDTSIVVMFLENVLAVIAFV